MVLRLGEGRMRQCGYCSALSLSIVLAQVETDDGCEVDSSHGLEASIKEMIFVHMYDRCLPLIESHGGSKEFVKNMLRARVGLCARRDDVLDLHGRLTSGCGR